VYRSGLCTDTYLKYAE